jgi:hypothetical protein
MPERQIVHTIALKAPVRIGSEQIEELQFERMRAEHIWSFPATPSFGDFFEIAARLAGQPTLVMKQLGMKDAAEVITFVNHEFAPFAEAIGGTP